jgi:hypothetical protein
MQVEAAVPDTVVQREFESYMQATYPGQLLRGSDRYQHLRGAFFAGALVALDRRESRLAMLAELAVFANPAPIANQPLH